ncbi:MAG: hypothetical protein JO061_09300 [Acidobacteriaceae bacterium]|nr:hypothetical protein [Acidobacteriaceae bacterium]
MAQTKIFGMKLGVDPKVVIGALVVVAALVFWYNSRSDDETSPSTAARQQVGGQAPLPAARTRARRTRRGEANNVNRGTLEITDVDVTDGRIDPTLRLDMLARLQAVPPAEPSRSLFEIGSSEDAKTAAGLHGPTIPVNPLPPPRPVTPQPGGSVPGPPVLNIPLRFYGFAHPAAKNEANRGLFMDGDNILVAVEGQMLEGKYLVVEMNQTSARLEDVQLRQGQTLPVVPEAMQQ